jgi:chloramphenicol 3-O phosphotransferase
MSVIFLNGCTSAGKTSIAVALQDRLRVPHLRRGIDDGFAMLPRKLHDHLDGFFFDTDDRGEIRLNHGAFGFATLKANARAAAAIAMTGVNLILDEVLIEDVLKTDWREVLDGTDVFWVGIHCALPELERRERARGDRLIGQARGQFDLVHSGMRYDLEIDSTSVPAAESAAIIVDAYDQWNASHA